MKKYLIASLLIAFTRYMYGDPVFSTPVGLCRLRASQQDQSLLFSSPFSSLDHHILPTYTNRDTQVVLWDVKNQRFRSYLMDNGALIDSATLQPLPTHMAAGTGFFIQGHEQDVFVCGPIAFNATQHITPGMSLWGLPFPVPTTLEKSPLYAVLTNGNDSVADQYANKPGTNLIPVAQGLWYVHDRQSPAASCVWAEVKPYSALYSSTIPRIADMELGKNRDTLILTIETEGLSGAVDIWYQDKTMLEPFNPVGDWQIAVRGLEHPGYWEDAGAENRPGINEVEARYYLISHGLQPDRNINEVLRQMLANLEIKDATSSSMNTAGMESMNSMTSNPSEHLDKLSSSNQVETVIRPVIGRIIYIAPSGNDEYDGRSAIVVSSAPSQTEAVDKRETTTRTRGPVRSIATGLTKAEIIKERNGGQSTVMVLDGDYHETIRLMDEDVNMRIQGHVRLRRYPKPARATPVKEPISSNIIERIRVDLNN